MVQRGGKSGYIYIYIYIYIYTHTQYNNVPQRSREGDLIQERPEKMERWRQFMIGCKGAESFLIKLYAFCKSI